MRRLHAFGQRYGSVQQWVVGGFHPRRQFAAQAFLDLGQFGSPEQIVLLVGIEVHIVESGEALGGLGEPATPPIAAAVTNAIYILTGQRVRELPIKNHDFALSNPVAQV